MKDIVISRLYKSFGEKTVLNGVDLTLPAGKVTCIMAPSGGGKTTLLNILAGLAKPDAGALKNVPERIGYVFQEDRLLEERSAASNIRFAVGKSVTDAEIASLLAELEIENTSQPVREFSGGMKRRVAIARALAYGGDLLLLDEPFKGLDGALREKTAQSIVSRTAGKTVVCVTHDEDEAALLGAEIVRI